MKFGRLIYRYTGKTVSDKGAIFNIGDNIQSFAIDHFYRKMGIKLEDIVDVNASEMKYYDGEYVILPMAGYASHYKRFNQLPTSDKIIPFFISFEMSDEECDDLIPYLKKNEPIGCRDEETMKLLRRKGVEAYTSGCLTITLPRRDPNIIGDKVFLVDIPEELRAFVPDEVLKNYEEITHEGILETIPMSEDERVRIEEHALLVMEKYKNEAKLVVTSRLHVVSPCIAMGIPVILAIKNLDSRFSWLDKLIPLYDLEHFSEIDWNPKPIELEETKDYIFSIFSKRLNKIYEEKNDIYNLSEFWENRNRVEYNSTLKNKLNYLIQKYTTEQSFNFLVWGAGVHGKIAIQMIKNIFPNSNLVAIVDKYMSEKIMGIDIIKPIDVSRINFDYALITTHPGRFEAVDVLSSLGKKKNSDWCYFISKDVPEDI